MAQLTAALHAGGMVRVTSVLLTATRGGNALYEVRLAKIAHEPMRSIRKSTVDFVDNHDGTENSGRHADQKSESAGERFFRYRSWYGDEYPAAQPDGSD